MTTPRNGDAIYPGLAKTTKIAQASRENEQGLQLSVDKEGTCCRLLRQYRRLLKATGGADTPETERIYALLEERLCGHAHALERVEASLRQSEAQLRQAQKMEAIGCLAGGAAHDFNNVLSVILAVSDLVLAELDPDSSMHHDVELIREAGTQGARLSRQLLMFSRRQITEPKIVDTQALLANVEKMLQRVLGEDVAFRCYVPTAAPCVKADPGLLEQVLMNLAVNARDAMPDGGRLEIEVASAVISAPAPPDVPTGPCAVFTVTDSGAGMDAATQARIFEPFFTTKEPGRGTGLGLSTVFAIVRQCGGCISVFSEPGKGTRFVIYLPSVEAEHDSGTQEIAQRFLGGNETILVVEDDDQVRTVATDVLRRHGYDVIEASNAGEALLACEKHLSPIHLLLTDVVMPRMNGPELASRLAQVRPDMKVLYMSGHTNGVAAASSATPCAPCLQKPLTVSALTQQVREVLDSECLETEQASSAA